MAAPDPSQDGSPGPRPDAGPPSVAPERRRPRWSRRLKGCALAAGASLIVLAVGLELGARLLLASPFGTEGELVGMYQNAEHWGGVRTVPGWRGQHTVDGRSVPVRLDRLGLRGPEVGARRPGELRILCTGDSFVFGYGVLAEEAFPAVLAERLAARLDRPVVAGNSGVPGNGLIEQARALERLAPAFDPDVVVATLYLGNDFVDDQYQFKYVEAGYSVTGEWAHLLRSSPRARLMLHSRAWMWVEMTLIEAGLPWSLVPPRSKEQQRAFDGWPSLKRPNHTVGGFFMDVIDERHAWVPPDGPPVVPRVLARMAATLTEIRAHAGRARVLLLVLPTWYHLVPEQRRILFRKMGLDASGYEAGLAQRRVRRVCGSVGIPVLDITGPASELEDPGVLFLQEDRHLNPEGHRFVAEQLAEVVEALLR